MSKKISTIFIPEGYSLEDMLDMDDGGVEEEPPMRTEEVRLQFGRDEQRSDE